jgi:hypothetical protein
MFLICHSLSSISFAKDSELIRIESNTYPLLFSQVNYHSSPCSNLFSLSKSPSPISLELQSQLTCIEYVAFPSTALCLAAFPANVSFMAGDTFPVHKAESSQASHGQHHYSQRIDNCAPDGMSQDCYEYIVIVPMRHNLPIVPVSAAMHGTIANPVKEEMWPSKKGRMSFSASSSPASVLNSRTNFFNHPGTSKQQSLDWAPLADTFPASPSGQCLSP